ncbi:hypothetical protein [Algibacter luteus]|uniref:Uncharacterized protein n=1 Tax=Algibacter luteus TaxID=1178825 RepID=A0A1M6DLY2_9FLAO|nr:hypothetical protein [Algibacter luteus]SHI74327.1 hypothetical protein SAMN05216261_1640 [Algibacter luteus]
MNYAEIVYDAFDLQNRLDKYFLDKSQEAEQKYYSKIQFFDGCLRVVKKLQVIVNLDALQKEEDLFLLLKKEEKLIKKNSYIPEFMQPVSLELQDLARRLKAKSVSETISINSLEKINESLLKTKKICNELINDIGDLKISEVKKQLLKRYIWDNRHSDFIKTNESFVKYWNDNKQTNKDLIYYLHYLLNKEFFRKVVDGKAFKATYGKDFLSLYFYGDKLALSEAKKQYYKNLTVKNNHLYTILAI